uniref:Uncharacterized protein n=1 Tax=Salmonella phage vB_STmST313_KE27 TaxID=3161178 RepID=A0AAU8GHY7_9CAUD
MQRLIAQPILSHKSPRKPNKLLGFLFETFTSIKHTAII